MSEDRRYEFQKLAIRVNNALIKNKGLIGDQREQVEALFRCENELRQLINNDPKSDDIYMSFINKIVQERGNILTASSFFRERSKTFKSKIIPCIKNKDFKGLKQFNINNDFISFVLEEWGGPIPKEIEKKYKEFRYIREILIENNIPLAINRAKLFYRKTPKSHLNLLDLIDICVCGLISGIDKYSGGYRREWRSVCIGNMTGYMLKEYNSTFIRMFPSDKKILYRANSLKHRLNIESFTELTEVVNESFEKDKKEGKAVPKLPISEIHIETLINGCHYVPADPTPKENEHFSPTIYDVSVDTSTDIEEQYANKDAMQKVIGVSGELDLIQRKIIKLKGVDL